MPRNIEIKARLATTADGSIDGIDGLRARVAKLATGAAESISQDDTFFKAGPGGGRIKLRVFGDGSGELISYRRADAAGPKASDYVRATISDPPALRATLRHAFGEAGRVVKHRTLLLVGRTRVHLDRVVGLGEFLELEVVLADGEDEAAGVAEAHSLLQALAIGRDQLVSGAYVDLLRQEAGPAGAAPDAGAEAAPPPIIGR